MGSMGAQLISSRANGTSSPKRVETLAKVSPVPAKKWLLTPLLVISWYGANIGVVLLNKFLLSYYGFKYPILLTLLHMLACSVFCAVSVSANVVTPQALHSKAQVAKIALLSTIFAATIILGNVSLRHIPVSFNQAIGATTPFFTAVLSFLIQGKRESVWTYAALIPVVGGIIIATGFEPSFHLVGFAACLSATALRALKSVVQAVLLSEPTEKMDSFNLLTYMAPMAVVSLIPTLLILEPQSLPVAYDLFSTKAGFVQLIMLNCTLAFFANLLNFLVTRHTSALSLQVLGNAKGVVAAIISVMLFQNAVAFWGCVGYATAVLGVVLYSESKKMRLPESPLKSPPQRA